MKLSKIFEYLAYGIVFVAFLPVCILSMLSGKDKDDIGNRKDKTWVYLVGTPLIIAYYTIIILLLK